MVGGQVVDGRGKFAATPFSEATKLETRIVYIAFKCQRIQKR